MKLAVDVDYREDKAVAAGVLFQSWQSCEATQLYTATLSDVEKYEPGKFYQRELPCILTLLELIEPLPEVIITVVTLIKMSWKRSKRWAAGI